MILEFDDPLAVVQPPAAKGVQMRPYQRDTIDAILAGWVEYKRQLAVLATGGGKTMVFSELARIEATNGGKVLILAHTDELIEQAREKFTKVSGMRAAKEKANAYAGRWDKVVVGSVQTLCRDARLKSFNPRHFSLIVVDEAHHALATSYQKILTYFDARILGVTATADRSDKKALGDFFEHIAYEYGMLQACRDGWLVRPVVQTVPLNIDLRSVHKRGGDFAADEVAHRDCRGGQTPRRARENGGVHAEHRHGAEDGRRLPTCGLERKLGERSVRGPQGEAGGLRASGAGIGNRQRDAAHRRLGRARCVVRDLLAADAGARALPADGWPWHSSASDSRGGARRGGQCRGTQRDLAR